jgi:hypothetical protein
MRLNLLLPRVEPDVYPEPPVCPNPQCGGQHFHLRQPPAPPPTRVGEAQMHL